MQEANELIKQQARYVSHEIRNQLSISEVYCEVIKKHLAKMNIQNESIEKALDCIQKSAKLIGNSLLDLKTITNINPQITDLNNIIEESISLSKVYIFDKKIDITTNLQNNFRILIDENKLQACLVNILKNAIEAIDSKGTISIKTLSENNTIKLLISNNGKPIPQKLQKEIFKDGITTKAEGSGIGLYLSRNNLIAQNADLKLVQSNSKKTTFEITLPTLN